MDLDELLRMIVSVFMGLVKIIWMRRKHFLTNGTVWFHFLWDNRAALKAAVNQHLASMLGSTVDKPVLRLPIE